MKDTILCSLKPYKLCGFKVGQLTIHVLSLKQKKKQAGHKITYI